LLISVGLPASHLVDRAFSGAQDWHATFGVGAILVIALAAGGVWLPGSPA
jgi:hypothetical protein